MSPLLQGPEFIINPLNEIEISFGILLSQLIDTPKMLFVTLRLVMMIRICGWIPGVT